MILNIGPMRTASLLLAVHCFCVAWPLRAEDALADRASAGFANTADAARVGAAVVHTTVDRRPGVPPPISRAFLQESSAPAVNTGAGIQESQSQDGGASAAENARQEAHFEETSATVLALDPAERLAQEEPVLGSLVSPSESNSMLTVDPHEELRILSLPDLRTDICEFPDQIWSDTRSLATVSTGLGLGIGAGLAAVSANNWDQAIRDNTAAHPRRWGGFNNVFDVAGHPATAGGVAAVLYATSLVTDDPELHGFSTALINSLILTNLSAVSLKYAFDTTRPNGESYGFPSGHTASAFAVAAVVQEYQGGFAGAAAYAFAGLVAWQRIDDRKHDLSDILFGMALGEVIGRSVARNHRLAPAGFELGSYIDVETGTTGVSLSREF